MSDRTLELLAELRGALTEPFSETSAAKWWDKVESIDTDLALDPKYTASEENLVRRLREGVSDVILAHRDGLNPHTGPASVAITGLESSIRRRTTGQDGWPLG